MQSIGSRVLELGKHPFEKSLQPSVSVTWSTILFIPPQQRLELHQHSLVLSNEHCSNNQHHDEKKRSTVSKFHTSDVDFKVCRGGGGVKIMIAEHRHLFGLKTGHCSNTGRGWARCICLTSCWEIRGEQSVERRSSGFSNKGSAHKPETQRH